MPFLVFVATVYAIARLLQLPLTPVPQDSPERVAVLRYKQGLIARCAVVVILAAVVVLWVAGIRG